MAVSGACLTMTALAGDRFQAEISLETLERTTFNDLKSGSPVNLERALTLQSRLGGHLVTGHIDATGQVIHRAARGGSLEFKIRVPEELSRYLIPKGSVAVDGASLTINACQLNEISVNIIPHTLQRTTLDELKPGARVNIEVDVLAKYVERLLGHWQPGEKGKVDLELLAAHGFLTGKH